METPKRKLGKHQKERLKNVPENVDHLENLGWLAGKVKKAENATLLVTIQKIRQVLVKSCNQLDTKRLSFYDGEHGFPTLTGRYPALNVWIQINRSLLVELKNQLEREPQCSKFPTALQLACAKAKAPEFVLERGPNYWGKQDGKWQQLSTGPMAVRKNWGKAESIIVLLEQYIRSLKRGNQPITEDEFKEGAALRNEIAKFGILGPTPNRGWKCKFKKDLKNVTGSKKYIRVLNLRKQIEMHRFGGEIFDEVRAAFLYECRILFQRK